MCCEPNRGRVGAFVIRIDDRSGSDRGAGQGVESECKGLRVGGFHSRAFGVSKGFNCPRSAVHSLGSCYRFGHRSSIGYREVEGSVVSDSRAVGFRFRGFASGLSVGFRSFQKWGTLNSTLSNRILIIRTPK